MASDWMKYTHNIKYSKNKTRTLRNKVYVNEYELMTGDSFEIGDAYSIHLTEEESKNFKPWGRCWAGCNKAKSSFISDVSLEKIMQTKEKYIFDTREN
jgi:hypothetical protein